MYSKIKQILGLLDRRTQFKLIIFSGARMFIGIVDVVGVLLIGLLLAKSVNNLGTSPTSSNLKLSKYLGFLDSFTVIQLALIATAAFAVKSLLSSVLTKYMLNNFAVIEVDLASNTFRYLLNNMAWTIKHYSKSDVNYLLTTAISSTIQMLSAYVVVISEFFFLILIFFSFAVIDLKITLFIIIYFSFIAFMLHGYLGRRFKESGIRSVGGSVGATTVIYDTIQSYREVISLKRESYFLNKFKKHKFDVSRASFDIQFLNTLPRYIVETSLLFGALGIIYFSLRTGDLEQSAQTIGIFLTGSMKIMTSLMPLQTFFAHFKNQIEISKKFLDFEEITKITAISENKIDSNAKDKATDSPIGINVRNLDFNYGDPNVPVLKDINLSIEPGRTVAIIGPSGSGKSTLADLIIGITKPESGTIEYFTEANTSLDRDRLTFGYVPQSPGKIYGTIKENIAFGVNSEEINLDSLKYAIEISHMSEVVDSLEHGFETHTGEQSDDLSGGQMQRIGLARALYVRPNLLVLDEATSALDVETEAAVSQSLESLHGNCTVVVIAHRLSTVKNADTVFVMNDGEIVAQGKFDELAQSNEMVARYVQLSNLEITK